MVTDVFFVITITINTDIKAIKGIKAVKFDAELAVIQGLSNLPYFTLVYNPYHSQLPSTHTQSWQYASAGPLGKDVSTRSTWEYIIEEQKGRGNDPRTPSLSSGSEFTRE